MLGCLHVFAVATTQTGGVEDVAGMEDAPGGLVGANASQALRHQPTAVYLLVFSQDGCSQGVKIVEFLRGPATSPLAVTIGVLRAPLLDFVGLIGAQSFQCWRHAICTSRILHCNIHVAAHVVVMCSRGAVAYDNAYSVTLCGRDGTCRELGNIDRQQQEKQPHSKQPNYQP